MWINKKTVLGMLLVLTLLTGCKNLPGGGAGDPMRINQDQDSNLTENEAEGFLEQDFNFEMYATVNGLVDRRVADTMESDWIGEFSTDSDGIINGQGSVTYEMYLYNADDKGCGYRWKETGSIDFKIGGKVHIDGNNFRFPVKILELTQKDLEIGPAEATCSDPDSWRDTILDLYIELAHDALIGAVLDPLHRSLGNEIQFGTVLEKKISTVDFGILVGPAAVPLDD